MVQLQTNFGLIVITLRKEKAPKTVQNFLRYAKEGFYKNTLFHRLINGFIVQGGGFEKGMAQKATYKPIENEANNNLRNTRGTVAMARLSDNPHSATSQFFINLADNDFLNYTAPTPEGWGYCVFGEVKEGMHVIDRIREIPTGTRHGHSNVPYDDVVIEDTHIM